MLCKKKKEIETHPITSLQKLLLSTGSEYYHTYIVDGDPRGRTGRASLTFHTMLVF